MIVTISGTVADKSDAAAVIETGGIGYRVLMNAPSLAALSIGEKAKLWTHEYLREDSHELYGFASPEEHRLFRKLLVVSGVGPKIALAMLCLGAVADIEKSIDKGDVEWLCRVPGIGKKTAQKIVLELKGKLVGESAADAEQEQVLSALMNLGYSRERAREALARARPAEKVEDRLRLALRELGR